MAKQEKLTLADLIAGQQRIEAGLKSSSGIQERLSMDQYRALAHIEKLQVQDRIIQGAGLSESIKSEHDSLKMIEEMSDGLLKKDGDGLNANIIKLLKYSKDSYTLALDQKKDILDASGKQKEFKSIGQRVGGIKEGFKDFFTMRGFLDKTGIAKRGSGGFISEGLDANEAAKKKAEARWEAGDHTAKHAAGTVIDGKKVGGQAMAKGDAIKEYTKQAKEEQGLRRQQGDLDRKLQQYKDDGLNDEAITHTKEHKAKLALAPKFAALNPASQEYNPSLKEEKEEKEAKVSKSGQAKKEDLTEADIEDGIKQSQQIELLTKIEENTRGANAEQVKPEEGKEQKGGMFGGFGKGLSGIGGALGGAAKGLLALAASVWIISKAFQNFATVKFSDFMMGIGAITALVVATKFIKDGDASKTLLALGAALLITSIAFKNFADIDWETMGKGILAIGALTAAVIAIGMLGPVVLAGAATLLALGAALWVASKAFENVAESMDTFAAGMERLGAISGTGLMETAAGILAVSAAMATFGAGSAVAGLGNLVSGLLSIGQDSPIDKLEKISKLGDGLQKAADALERIGKAMQTISGSGAGIEVGKDSIKTTGAKKAPMTKIAGPDTKTSETVSGTLKGVTGDQIRSHPNFKKYLAEEEANFPGSPENYASAADRVKVDMVKEQSPQVKQVTPTAGNKVYGASSKNVEAANKPTKTQGPAIVNAPTTINKSIQNSMIKSPLRNPDNTLMTYNKTRFST